MEARRFFWLCFACYGALALVNSAPREAVRSLDPSGAISLLGASGILALSLYGTFRPFEAGGPTEHGPMTYLAALAVVLYAAGVVL